MQKNGLVYLTDDRLRAPDLLRSKPNALKKYFKEIGFESFSRVLEAAGYYDEEVDNDNQISKIQKNV